MNRDLLAKLITEELTARLVQIPVPVTVSNRHIHLDENARQVLFGDEALNIKRFLRQPGEFAAA